MNIIGITGGSGAGKSTVTAVWRRLGAVILDADAVYRDVLGSNLPLQADLAARFGNVLRDGALDRKRLAKIVFSDKQALSDLNAMTHPYVIEAIRSLLDDQRARGAAVCAIDAIYLLETELRAICHPVVGVTCPVDQRVTRIIARDALNEEQARQRVKNQQNDEYYRRHCDLILENTGDMAALEQDAETLFRQIMEE